MDAIKAILSRRSIRKYTSKVISKKLLTELLKAGMSAPSAGNKRPWHFIIIDDHKIMDKIPEFHPYSWMLKDAQVSILVCGDKQINKYDESWIHDCSAATENILIAANAKGLGAVWLGIFPKEERVKGIRQLIELPKHIVPFSLIALGYPAEKKSPANRYDETRVHYNGWQYNMNIQHKAMTELLKMLPDKVHTFDSSEYPLPLKTTFLGNEKLDISNLRQKLIQKQNEDVKKLLEPLLLAAEQCEAAKDDKKQFFLNDRTVQTYVFRGSKWRAGWVLVLGGKNQNALIEKLKEQRFMIFTDLPDIPDTIYIGNRSTSPIYFAQLMVRYGLIWGGISPGHAHEMEHFLEEDMPGFIIIYRDLSPLKYLIILGLMKLGAPAVVPSTYPFPYGRRIIAHSIPEILASGNQFSNLRQRYYKDEILHLPDFCHPEYTKEEIEIERTFGNTSLSFFCLRPVDNVEKKININGTPEADMGILIEVAAEHFNDDIALIVEKEALKALNFLHGIHAFETDGLFHLELGKNVKLKEKQIADAIYWVIRLKYPKLEQIAIHIIFDKELLKKEAPKINNYKNKRHEYIKNMSEENTEEFCACTECRPFSLVHTCILTPGRIPMCASRTYSSVKASAYFGSSSVPWKRRSEKDLPLRYIFKKGKLLDPECGEYTGCNQIYQEMTGGQLQRVFLHSLRNYPVTSCGCFQALAFWMDESKGIGIMSRNSRAVAPGGKTWEILANYAGGKQSSGIAGVSLSYIRSPDFLKGDGGIGNVIWVDSELYKKISDLFLSDQKVATEKNVTTMAELSAFLKD
jgi:CO dehydrogenase/acetyl-CoA synthase beta subunit/nitroreductase